jgi:hypothetical protein
MMMKTAILRWLEEMESKLAELRAVIQQLPEAPEAPPMDALTDLEQEEGSEDTNDLHEVFVALRAAWHIPSDVQPDLPIEDLQNAMAEGLPENWASREIMRLREE